MMSPLNGQLQSDGSYIVPVSSLTTSTQVTFNFNGGSITVNPVDLVQGYSVGRIYLLVCCKSQTERIGPIAEVLPDVCVCSGHDWFPE